MIGDTPLPAAAQASVRAVLIDRAHPLLLTFDADRRLGEVHGDSAYYGIDVAAADGCDALLDLFIGLPLDRDHDIPFVELPNGRSVHVHLIAGAPGFHLLLVDAEDARAQRRAQQQLANEAIIAGQAKAKAIGQLKDIRTELERQRASLEEANALKNALISTLSHDFRTPLTSIFGYLRYLEPQTTADPRAQQALRAIRRSAGHLLALAENLLEYGRGEAGGGLVTPVDVDLDALRADIEAMFVPLAETKGLAFHARLARGDDRVARFDPVKLRQVLVNLVSNALHYTPHGEVDVTLAWRDGVLRIEVRDTGVGIAPEYQAAVFRAFDRGAQTGGKGAGLGLSIVRRVVEQMHGRISLESVPRQGTCVSVELPTASAAPDMPGSMSSRGRRVIVVDDDPDVAQLIELLLIDLGLDVRVFATAQGAIEAVQADPPDLLLVDVELPDLSGNAAVFRLRADGYAGAIVTLSANATEDARTASLRAGANHYLTKPIDLERFNAVVAHALATTTEDAP